LATLAVKCNTTGMVRALMNDGKNMLTCVPNTKTYTVTKASEWNIKDIFQTTKFDTMLKG
jgi:hypothetical protein